MANLQYGVTNIKNSDGQYKPLRGLWYKNSANVWSSIETASVKLADGTWQRVYPTPAGINSATPSTANLTVYQHYGTTQTINFTNTGDHTLTIGNVIEFDGNDTITTINFSGTNGGYPYTISPGGTGYITANVYGKSVGTTSGNITFINDTGYFGTDGNIAYWPGNQTVIPITTQVLPNYNGISVNPASINYSFYQGATPASANVVITNSGNGANLHVNLITSEKTVVSGISLPETINFDFNTYTGNTAQFTVTAPAFSAGVYSDILKIYSDALNTQQSGGYITIPVNFTVLATHGNKIFATPGTYTWTVLPGILLIQVAIIGGGGGGGGSTEVGNGGGGGGGGSGGVVISTISVTPGETITITVGSGGAGSPFVGRDAGAAGSEGPGQPGGTSSIVYNSNSISATGGQGGTQAYGAYSAYGQGGLNGFGGDGGQPGGAPGNNGTLGTDDYSSTYGGAGGNNGFVFINNGGQPTDQFQLETINTSDSSLYAATLYGTYNDFLNTYGVWTNADLVAPVGSWIDVNFYTTLLISGTYTLTVSADNHIRVYIDGNFIGGNDDWGTTNSYSVSLTAGNHTILCQALNDGGPASFAAALTDPNGSVEWSTRSPLEFSPNPNNIYGRGGAGADAPDRVSPYNWAGNPGTSGAVILSW